MIGSYIGKAVGAVGSAGGTWTLEDRVEFLEDANAALTAQLAAQLKILAPADTWFNTYRLPQGNPIDQPRSDAGMVMRGPLVIEDPNIEHDEVRWVLSHRIEHEWRQGPQSSGVRFMLGNPKAWFRGGVMVTAANDTSELMLAMAPVDEATGAPTGFPTLGTQIGRIYETVVYPGQNGEMDMTARSNDMIFRYRGGVDIRASDNETTHKPQHSAWFLQPQPLNSGLTGWRMGFSDTPPDEGITRRVRLARKDQVPDDMLVLYIDPDDQT
jgi:hypothetical protein